MTREEWLNAALTALRPHFAAASYTIPERVRVTCGFPSKGALATRKRSIGECWSDTSSADSTHEVMISPLLDDAAEVLAVLVHELAHATVGLKCKHRGAFVRCVRAMKLEGKPTATVAGEAFTRDIGAPVLAGLAPYPHARLTAGGAHKKQSTRMIKCTCGMCGYVARTTRKWLDAAGAPICPLDNVQMSADDAGGDEGDGE